MNINNKIRLFLKRFVSNWIDGYRVRCIKKDWTTFAKKHLKVPSLTVEEIIEIEKIYKPFGKYNSIIFDFYKEKTGEFSSKFVPDDIYYGEVDPYFNDWKAALYLDNKCYYANFFSDVKQPETVLLRMNDIWFDSKRYILTEEKVNDILTKEQNLFIKIATESDGGQGVRHFNNENDIQRFWDFVLATKSDIIVQRGVIQHEELNKLNDSSVNTIRILSLLSREGVKIYSAVLRMGVNGSKVDNEASGGRTCGILENGCLKTVAHNKYGESFLEHPNSHIKFEGYKVPCFKKLIDIVPKLHVQVPQFRLISWDFAIDANEDPVLIEANFRYGGVTIHQLNNGPIFGEDTEKILMEVYGKKKE